MPKLLPWLPGTPVGAVIAKELRLTTRDPRRRIGLLQLVVIGLGGPVWFAVTRSTGSPGVVFAASIAGYLAILGAMNQFALDGGALWIDIVAGDRIRAELAGKNLAVVVQAVPVMLVGTISVATITDQWRYVPVAMLVGLGGLGAGLAVADIVSVRFPQKPPDSRNPFAGAGGGAALTQFLAVFAAILIQGVVISPIALATAITIAVAPAALVVVAPACAAYGYVLWRVGIGIAHGWAAPRQPELLAVVDGRRGSPSSTVTTRTMRWAPPVAAGAGFDGHHAGASAAVPVTGSAALRAGLRALWRRRRQAALATITMAVPIVGLYIVMAGANGLAFGYNPFPTDPPSGTANVVSGISLAVFWVLENGVLAWMFGAFVALGLDPDASTGRALTRSWHALVRRSWRAVPAMLITSAAVLAIVLGPPLIAAFAPFALGDVVDVGTPGPASARRRIPGTYGRHLVIGLPIAALALGSVIVGAQFGGHDVPNAVVITIFVALAAVVAAFTAWTAFAAAELHLAT